MSRRPSPRSPGSERRLRRGRAKVKLRRRRPTRLGIDGSTSAPPVSTNTLQENGSGVTANHRNRIGRRTAVHRRPGAGSRHQRGRARRTERPRHARRGRSADEHASQGVGWCRSRAQRTGSGRIGRIAGKTGARESLVSASQQSLGGGASRPRRRGQPIPQRRRHHAVAAQRQCETAAHARPVPGALTAGRRRRPMTVYSRNRLASICSLRFSITSPGTRNTATTPQRNIDASQHVAGAARPSQGESSAHVNGEHCVRRLPRRCHQHREWFSQRLCTYRPAPDKGK